MHKYIFYIIISFGLSGTMMAQQPVTASAGYLSQIQKSKPDTARISLYFLLGKFYISQIKRYYSPQEKFTDSAAWAFTRGIELGDSLHTKHRWIDLKRMLGKSFFFKGDTIAAEKVFMEVLEYCRDKGLQEQEAFTWQAMGNARQRNNENFPAIAAHLLKAMELFRSLGQTENQANTQLQIADLHAVMGRMEEAENEALQALYLYRQINHVRLYDTYYMLSVINRYQGDLDRALFFAMRCVRNVDSLQDIKHPVYFYGELALVYDGLGLGAESAKWYKLTLEERKKWTEEPIVILRTAGLLIHQLVKINKGPEALSVILDIQKSYPPHSSLERWTIAQYLGYCYQSLGKYGKAENYFIDMLSELGSDAPPDEFNSMAYQDIGNFYLVTKKYDKAALYLSKAIDPPNTYLVSRQRDIYLSLYMADSALGNYLAAINDFRQYKMLTDSLFSERKSLQIEELQIKYQTEKKEKDIILLNSQNKAQENQLQRSALIRNFIIAAVLLLAGVLYYRYRLKSISNKKMQEQQRLIYQKNISLTQLVTEKEWLVKEIHHRVKNNFHTVMGLLATQSQFLKNPEAIDAMRESRHRIQAMSLIHQKLYQSDNLSTISMPGYIHELVNSLRESFDIPSCIQFNFDIDPVNLDLSHAIPLGLILNEAITNAIKYAFPGGRKGTIGISIKQDQDPYCRVVVRDDGIGFPVTSGTTERGMGMKLMKGLSEDMEGTIAISGQDGTTIRIAFLNDSQKKI